MSRTLRALSCACLSLSLALVSLGGCRGDDDGSVDLRRGRDWAVSGGEEDLAVASGDKETTDDSCSDGVDNDGNGHTDCDDYSCCKAGTPGAGITVCESGTCVGPGKTGGDSQDMAGGGGGGSESTDDTCGDGIDNDGDGHTDCNDFDCCKSGKPASGVTVCASGTCYGPGYGPKDGGTTSRDMAGVKRDMAGGGGSENTNTLCGDGIDNDGDGHTDCNDFDCCKSGVPASGVTVCAKTTCYGPGYGPKDGGTSGDAGSGTKETTNALCSDGKDNDSNGFTDCNDYSCCSKAGVPATGVTVCAMGTCKGPGKP